MREIYHHPVLPLYVIGRWFGAAGVTGDGSGGTVTAKLAPALPAYYPDDFYFTLLNLQVMGPDLCGDQHELVGNYDDWLAMGDPMSVSMLIEGVDQGSYNLPSKATIPLWLSWLLHRVNQPTSGGSGDIESIWETNVNGESYKLGASGLILADLDVLSDALVRRIVRL
jgi:hypothetical protein